MPAPTYDALKGEYARLCASMEIRPSKEADINATASKIVAKKAKQAYMAVQKATGVPWYVVGVIHAMEAGCNFNCHLHNGDPLTARTVQVPKGRPKTGAAPFKWEDSAIDAIQYDGLHKVKDWTIERICYELEKFNGWGYRTRKTNINSPYLWSGSNHYARGKFVRDGVFSASVVSGQSGAIPILDRILALDTSIKIGEDVEEPAPLEEVVADASLAFPRADAANPNPVTVAAKSRTVWTLLSAGTLKVVESTTDWLQHGWDGMLGLFGMLPAVAADAKEQIESADQITTWLQFDKATAAGIVTCVVVAALVIAVIRHTHDKGKLTP